MADSTEATVEVLSPADGATLFEACCRDILGITPAEFISAYDGGFAWVDWGHDAVARLSMLVPFAR